MCPNSSWQDRLIRWHEEEHLRTKVRHTPKRFTWLIVHSSCRESLIQIADVVAGATMRRDTRNDQDAFDRISGKIMYWSCVARIKNNPPR